MRAFFLGLLVALCAAGQDSVVDLSILHFNDFHSRLTPTPQGVGGAAHLATAIRRERANCTRCLLLNAGDNVQGSPVSTIFRGLPVFEVLRPLKTDAFVVGNHEFDYGHERIHDFVREAGHPVLAANLLNRDGKLFTGQASVILNRDGLRIGIVGVLMETLVPGLTTPIRFGPNQLLPALETLRAEAARLKDKTDVLIALVHLEARTCNDIVDQLPEYAITVSGHDHGGLPTMYRAGDRVGVRLRANGSELGRLNVRYDRTARKIVSADWKRIPITTAEFPADPEVAALVEKWESRVRAVVDKKIGTSPARLDRTQTREWIESIMRRKTGADFVHMNQGGVRDILPEGEILARNIWTLMPFDNMLVVAEVPGRLIPEFVRKGAAVEPDRKYKVATIDFLVEGWRSGRDEALRAFGQALPLDGPLLRDVLIESFGPSTRGN